MSTTKQMLTMRMLTNPFTVTAYDPQPIATGAKHEIARRSRRRL